MEKYLLKVMIVSLTGTALQGAEYPWGAQSKDEWDRGRHVTFSAPYRKQASIELIQACTVLEEAIRELQTLIQRKSQPRPSADVEESVRIGAAPKSGSIFGADSVYVPPLVIMGLGKTYRSDSGPDTTVLGQHNTVEIGQTTNLDVGGAQNAVKIRETSNTMVHGQSNTVAIGKTAKVDVSGSQNSASISEGFDIRLSGEKNTVAIGKMADVHISGSQNHATLGEAADVYIAAMNNIIANLRKAKNVSLTGVQNTVVVQEALSIDCQGNNHQVTTDKVTALHLAGSGHTVTKIGSFTTSKPYPQIFVPNAHINDPFAPPKGFVGSNVVYHNPWKITASCSADGMLNFAYSDEQLKRKDMKKAREAQQREPQFISVSSSFLQMQKKIFQYNLGARLFSLIQNEKLGDTALLRELWSQLAYNHIVVEPRDNSVDFNPPRVDNGLLVALAAVLEALEKSAPSAHEWLISLCGQIGMPGTSFSAALLQTQQKVFQYNLGMRLVKLVQTEKIEDRELLCQLWYQLASDNLVVQPRDVSVDFTPPQFDTDLILSLAAVLEAVENSSPRAHEWLVTLCNQIGMPGMIPNFV